MLDGLIAMVGGAFAVTIYLHWAIPNPPPEVGEARNLTGMIFFGASVLQGFFEARNRRREAVREPTPARAGIHVVIATGLMAAFMVGRPAMTSHDYWIVLLILVSTGIVSIAVWSFSANRAEDIGEARFDTTRHEG